MQSNLAQKAKGCSNANLLSAGAKQPTDKHPSEAHHETGDLQGPSSEASIVSAGVAHAKQQQCPDELRDGLGNVHNGPKDMNKPRASNGEVRPHAMLTAEQGVLMRKRKEKHKPEVLEGPSSGMGFWLQMRQAAGNKVKQPATNSSQPVSNQLPASNYREAGAELPQIHAPIKVPDRDAPKATALPCSASAGSPGPRLNKPLQAAPNPLKSSGIASARPSGHQRKLIADMAGSSGLQARQKQQGIAGACDSVDGSDSDSSSRSSQQLLTLQHDEDPGAVSHVEVCSHQAPASERCFCMELERSDVKSIQW